MTKSLKKNYLYNVLYQVISIIVPFITTPYTSRVLGVDAIGEYSYTASIVTYFSIFAALGLGMYGQREVAYSRDDKEKRSVVFFEVQLYKLVSTLISVIAFLVFVFRFIPEYRKTIYLVQMVTIISVFFDISWFFQGLEEFKLTVFRNLLVKLIGAACIFIFIHDREDLILFIALHCVITMVSNIVLWVYLPRYVGIPAAKELHPLKITFPMIELFIPVVAIQVYNVLDKTMIGSITLSSYESGCYEQTTKIISMIMALVTSLGTVLLPRMAVVYAEKDREQFESLATKAFNFVILVSFPLCTGLMAVSDFFVPSFFGPGYDKVTELIRIYSLVLVIIPLSNIAGFAILTPTGQHNKGTLAVITGAIVNFSLNMFLIPRLQSVGAALATIAAESAVTLVHLYFVKKYVDLRGIARYYVKSLVTSAVMGILVFVIGHTLILTGLRRTLVIIVQIISGVGIYYLLLTFVTKDQMLITVKDMVVQRVIAKKYKQ